MNGQKESRNLPDTLIDILDELDAATLRAVRACVERRLDELRPSLRKQIQSEAEGEIVDIEDFGAYTLVQKYPPSEGTSEEASQPLILYRVKRETQPNGKGSLHWSYLGDVTRVECENCGSLVNRHETACPNCGEETVHNDEEV